MDYGRRARIFMNQRKGRAGDLAAKAQRPCAGADESCFARAKTACKGYDIPGF
jgi:hypothetical protein